MKLKDCKHGIIIQDTTGCIGMIVGISTAYELESAGVRKDPYNARPLVQFAGEFKPRVVHQCHLELYKGNL